MITGDKPLTMTDLVTESERAKQLWFREYMNIGKFCTAHMRGENVLLDGVSHALNLLAKDDDQNAVGGIVSVLKDAVNKANAIRLESVLPQPAPKEVRKAFLWMAEKEGMNLLANSDGMFHSPRTQQAWDNFQKGATWAEKRMAQPEPVAEQPKKRWLA